MRSGHAWPSRSRSSFTTGGATERDTGPVRTHPARDDAGDLAQLLESLDLYPVHVVAHSYGGAVALRLALDRSEMVRSLALHEPPFVGLLEEDPATAPEAERLWAGTSRSRRSSAPVIPTRRPARS